MKYNNYYKNYLNIIPNLYSFHIILPIFHLNHLNNLRTSQDFVNINLFHHIAILKGYIPDYHTRIQLQDHIFHYNGMLKSYNFYNNYSYKIMNFLSFNSRSYHNIVPSFHQNHLSNLFIIKYFDHYLIHYKGIPKECIPHYHITIHQNYSYYCNLKFDISYKTHPYNTN